MVKYEIVKTLVYTKKITETTENYADYPVCAYVIKNIGTGEHTLNTKLGCAELVIIEGVDIINAQIVIQDNKDNRIIYFKTIPGYTPLKHVSMVENVEKYIDDHPELYFTSEVMRDIEMLRRRTSKK